MIDLPQDSDIHRVLPNRNEIMLLITQEARRLARARKPQQTIDTAARVSHRPLIVLGLR